MENNELTVEQVLEGFGAGISCSMAVFGQLAPSQGISREEARRIAAAFGGGMGHAGVCGCVTGALMALGLKYGNDTPGDNEKIALLRQKKKEFEERFLERFGSVNCPELLGGLNPAIPEQKAAAIQKGLMQGVCAPAVCAACDILSEMFEEDE